MGAVFVSTTKCFVAISSSILRLPVFFILLFVIAFIGSLACLVLFWLLRERFFVQVVVNEGLAAGES